MISENNRLIRAMLFSPCPSRSRSRVGRYGRCVQSCPALASAFAKGFKCNVEPDLVSISEAIRHCFCRGEDADTDAFDTVFLNSVGERFFRESNYAQRRIVGLRKSSLVTDCEPHLERRLRCEVVKS